MTAPTRDLALCLEVYDRLMAAYHAGPAGGVTSATDPADAILAKAIEYRALILQCPVPDSGNPVESIGGVSPILQPASRNAPQLPSLSLPATLPTSGR